MIEVTPEGACINGQWFDRATCIQVVPTWSWPHRIGLRDGVLYGITSGTQHGVEESYRAVLTDLESRLPAFEQAKQDLATATGASQVYAQQSPVVHTLRTIFGQDGPSLVKYGNVWVRRWWWKRGEGLDNHTHNFDHVALLYRGSADVTVDGIKTTYHAPIEIIIDKGKVHKIEALDDPTVWMCVFAVRDDEGHVDLYGTANNPASHT
jgi:quercetin dioxygenase-like cupin family protein